MPTKVNVRINTVQHTSQVSSTGNNLNYVEITGYNETDGKGFKKRFFATKKDGTATKNAETADALNKDDWCEIVLDDTSYKNVQTLKKIAAPANATAPEQTGTTSASNTVANKMSKADWAKKDSAKNESIARSVALKAAVDFMAGSGETDSEVVIDKAVEFEAYLLNGRRSPGDETVREVTEHGNVIVNPTQEEDEDIPF